MKHKVNVMSSTLSISSLDYFTIKRNGILHERTTKMHESFQSTLTARFNVKYRCSVELAIFKMDICGKG